MAESTYQLFDPLRPDEYEALAADIRKRGVLVPVEVDEDGNILDGHHRQKIADSLGVEAPRIVRQFDNEADKREHVLKINLLRRHLGPVAWARAFERLLEQRGVARGQGSRNDSTSATVAQVAEELGVPRRTAFHRLAVSQQLASHPDLAEQVDRGEIPAKTALRKVKASLVEGEEQERRVQVPTSGYVPALLHCSVAELTDHVKPGSVDVIITDPPYPKQYLNTYAELSVTASRILKDGGICVAMAGQSYLPDVFDRLASHLEYVWTVAYLTPGGQAVQVWDRGVNTFWKPLLVFRKGPRDKQQPWFADVTKSATNDNDKRFHHWGQSESGMRDVVERFSKTGDVVCDPFLGGGTTAVVATALDRRFIGCDINADSVEKTRRMFEVAS